MSDARVPWWRSLRVRIALVVTLVSLAVSTALGLVLAQRSASAATEALRTQALGQLTVVTDGYALDGRLRDGAVLDQSYAPAAVRAQLADTSVNKRVTYYDGRRMWAAARLGKDVVVTLALDGSTLTAQNTARLHALLWGLGAATLASAALGWISGTRLSRRLRAAATASRSIADGATDIHAAQSGRDEVAQLTRAVDDMAASLQHRIDVEREFTSDVAHELRTPLTGLVSAAELLPEGPESELVRAQVARLRRLVEDLLEISRLDRHAEPAHLHEVDLGAAVAASLDRLGPTIVPPGLTVQTASTDVIEVEDRRLDRVLANLLVNLTRHGAGRGELCVAGRRLELTDEGDGYPDDIVAHGPRPFHATGATKGSGLGLVILVKQAAAMGATVEFGRSSTGGALTVVDFPPRQP